MIEMAVKDIEVHKDRAQKFLMEEAKTNHQLVLSVLYDYTHSESNEAFLAMYPESHPAHSIAVATALVGV